MTPQYAPIEDESCWKCDTSPVVGLCTRWGPKSTGLCGACFFQDRLMVDWEEWNKPQEATE
jgi:hypothetical protein